MKEEKQQGSVTDHLANERTFLAWLRTSIGIMAFGFVVVKFSLFVKQISLLLNKQALTPSKGYSALLGIALVLIGAITGLLSYIRYKSVEKQLKEDDYKHSSVLITVITCLVFLVSTLLILYLVQNV